MIRLATWIIASLLLTALIAWLVSLPGTAMIEIAGYRMQPRLGMAAFVIAAGLAAVILAWSVLRWILDAPRYFAKLNQDRRRDARHRAARSPARRTRVRSLTATRSPAARRSAILFAARVFSWPVWSK